MNKFNNIWQSVVVASMIFAPLTLAKVTIYMCGDSTMQDWAEGYYPKQGQGQDFHFWFDVNKAAVVNRGQGGMSLGGGGKDKNGGTAVGYYDIEWKRSDGWQGEHLNTYINIGYQYRFGGHWAVDGGLGIGLLATKYRHYVGSSTYPSGHEEQHDDHLIWKEDGHLNLLAATHANISIAYLFDVQSLIPKRWRKKP